MVVRGACVVRQTKASPADGVWVLDEDRKRQTDRKDEKKRRSFASEMAARGRSCLQTKQQAAKAKKG